MVARFGPGRPDSPRITRSRAYPHPVSTPEHPGHANSPATSRRSTAAASTPTVNIGASAHHRAALPSPAKEHGRAAARPNLPTVMTSSKKGNPPRAALEHILAVNDASRLLRPHPECGRTAITERNQARRPARTDPARHTDRPGTPDKHRPALPIKSAGPSDSADQCRRGIARPIVPRPRHLRGGFAPAASPPSRNGRSAHGKVGLATKAAAGGRIIDPPSRSRVLFSHRPDSTACRNAISPGI